MNILCLFMCQQVLSTSFVYPAAKNTPVRETNVLGLFCLERFVPGVETHKKSPETNVDPFGSGSIL